MTKTTAQQGDIHLFQTTDDGEILVENGIVEMVGGLGVAAYLSLFGGNVDDDGSQNSTRSWWANFSETDPDRIYRAETQNLLQSIPATANNLLRIQKAVERDLDWFISSKIASDLMVVVSIPTLNHVNIVITITAEGVEQDFNFVENWKAST